MSRVKAEATLEAAKPSGHFAPTEYYRKLGASIQRWRLDRKMLAKELADGIGLSRVSITNIEAGRQPVQVHTLEAIAQVLGCSPMSLLRAHVPGRPNGPSGASSDE